MTKCCFKCGITKVVAEFYKHPNMGDGYLGKCKTCTKRDVLAREQHLRATDPLWVAKERERCRIKEIKRYHTGRKPPKTGAQQIANREWRKRTGALAAHNAVARALRARKLIRPSRCDQCRERCKPDAHHEDYTKYLEVRWLCKACHGLTWRKH